MKQKIELLKSLIAEPSVPQDEKEMYKKKLDTLEKQLAEEKGSKTAPKKTAPKKTTAKKTTAPKKETLDEMKNKIKVQTGKTEQECEEILAKYRQLADKNKKRINQLDKADELISGTTEITAGKVIDNATDKIADKIIKEVDQAEKEAEREAKKEVSTKGKTEKQVKDAIDKKVVQKIEKQVSDISKEMFSKTKKFILDIQGALGSENKEDSKQYLIDLRNEIDKMLSKYATGGIIEFSDGFKFKEVSKDYALKNWKGQEIYAINLDDESERLIESENDIKDYDMFAVEYATGGMVQDYTIEPLVHPFAKGGGVKNQLELGTEIEMEHAESIKHIMKDNVKVRDVAEMIAKDHIKEDPNYYSKLTTLKLSNGGEIVCENCDWKWNLEDGGNKPFVCTKCNHDNSNLYKKGSNIKNKSYIAKIIDSSVKGIFEKQIKSLLDEHFIDYYIDRNNTEGVVYEIGEPRDGQFEHDVKALIKKINKGKPSMDIYSVYVDVDKWDYFDFAKGGKIDWSTYYKKGGTIMGKEEIKMFYTPKGERKIDLPTIKKLTEYIESLPQTKSLNQVNGKYLPERLELHKEIINSFKENVVCIESKDPIAILMGGSPASGKSTFLKKYAPYLLSEEIFKVDADEVRSKLPEYEGWNASQTHLETKDIVTQLLSDREIGLPCKTDIIYDGTMNSTKTYKPLIKMLHDLGYKVFVVYVDNVKKDVIVDRALNRYKKSGRFVPLEVIDDFFEKGKTALQEIKKDADGYMIIDGGDSNYKVIEKGGKQLPKSRAYSKIGTPISKVK